jgi:hypothetical protein
MVVPHNAINPLIGEPGAAMDSWMVGNNTATLCEVRKVVLVFQSRQN